MRQISFCSDTAEFICIDFMLHIPDYQFFSFFKHVARDGFPTNVPPRTDFFFWMSKAAGNVLEFSHSIDQ